MDSDDVNLPPAMIKKSGGATLYITRDIATAAQCAHFNFVKNVYVVGRAIQPLPKSAQGRSLRRWDLTGYWHDHVDFGLVTKNRQKLSTRKETSSFWNQLCKKRLAVQAQIEEKNPNLKTKKAAPMQLCRSAVKFYDLKTTAATVMTLI